MIKFIFLSISLSFVLVSYSFRMYGFLEGNPRHKKISNTCAIYPVQICLQTLHAKPQSKCAL